MAEANWQLTFSGNIESEGTRERDTDRWGDGAKETDRKRDLGTC